MNRIRKISDEDLEKLWGFVLDEGIEDGDYIRERYFENGDKIAQLVYFQSFDAYLVQYGTNGDGFTDTSNHAWFLNQRDALKYFHEL